MKVIYDDRVYVQKKDLVYLLKGVIDNKLALPQSIFRQIYTKMLLEVDYDGNDFVKFTRKEEINYFDKVDFILDYNEFKNVNLYRLVDIGNKIKSERDYLIERINKVTIEAYWECNMIGLRCELLSHKLGTLYDIIACKKGQCYYSVLDDKDKKDESKKIFRKKYCKDKR